MKRNERLGDSGLMPDARRQRTMSPQFVPLRAPLTSPAWNGDPYSTTAKTLIDLSAVFGVPANAKAIVFQVSINDDDSLSGGKWLILAPNNVAGQGPRAQMSGIPDDQIMRVMLTVPCDANGDVYYQIQASGAGTMDVTLEIWAYFL